MSCRGIAAALFLLSAVQSGAARADVASTVGVAEALFESARGEIRNGDYEAAYPKLVESERIDPSNGTLLNLLLCEEKLGKVASAWIHARELVERLPPDDDRRSIVERRVATLSARVPRLTLLLSTAAPAQTKLLLDGVELTRTSLGIALPIDPGLHHVASVSPGREDRDSTIAIAEGTEQSFTVEPGEPKESKGFETTPSACGTPSLAANGSSKTRGKGNPAPTLDGHATTSAHLPRWIGWSTGSVGAAGIIVGTVLGALALDRLATVHEDCPGKQCRNQSSLGAAEEGKAFVAGSIAALAVGSVGLGFGIYVLSRSDAKSLDASNGSSHHVPAGGVVTYGFSL